MLNVTHQKYTGGSGNTGCSFLYAMTITTHSRRMIFSSVAVLGLIGAMCAVADARPNRTRYTTDKGFGLGVMVGAPSGISGKYFIDTGRTALAFGVGVYDDDFYGDDHTHFHLDVQFHPVALTQNQTFKLPLYIGVGGRFLDHNNHNHVGVRVPFGIAFDFRNTPLDLFFELVPVVDFLDERDHDDVDLTGAIGLRSYF